MRPPDRNSVIEYRNSAEYRKLREKIFTENPLCQLCKKDGFVTGATELDHIFPLHTHWEKRWDLDNLQMLCSPCHKAKTQKENEKRWRQGRGPKWDEFQNRLAQMVAAQDQT